MCTFSWTHCCRKSIQESVTNGERRMDDGKQMSMFATDPEALSSSEQKQQTESYGRQGDLDQDSGVHYQ